MSSFEDQMERRNSSTYSLISSRGGSELGSRYPMESGFYVTSFVATIFTAALIILGVLFMTLLITLTVMLQSCQNQTGGEIQQQHKTTDANAYCKLFALHADLNRLHPDDFPRICRAHTTPYIAEGQYFRDLKLSILIAKTYFSSLKPRDNFDVVLIDIDHIFHLNILLNTSKLQSRFVSYDGNNWLEEVNRSVRTIFLDLFATLEDSGWSLIYITKKSEKQRNATKEILASAGYGGRASLIMRSDEEMKMESWEYFSRRRRELCNQGFRIEAVISSRIDALTGPCRGNRSFKLPVPFHELESDFKTL